MTAKVTLSAGTQVGDLLVVKDGAGTALFSGQVTAEMLKDGLNVEVPVSGSPSEVKVTAQVTDQAGNPSGIADDTAKVDNVAARRRAWNCKAPVPTTPTTRQRL
ncbi:hypothetical protein C0708_22000 [Aeromonas caviae]|nr:hypothetical protein C0708_22000 [Aeromonas caviae]